MPAPLVSDIIILGGGVAGLAAARELGRRGLKVTLLEARDRLGGRIYTRRPAGWPGPVELGAEFVHGGNDALWRLLRKHRIGTRSVPPRHWLFREEKISKIADIAQEIENVTGEIDAQRMRGWSFADFMRGKSRAFSPEERNLAAGFVEGFQAASPSRMSAPAIEGETLEDAEQFLVPRGYAQLVAALVHDLRASRVTVLRKTVATRVTWRRGDVEVCAGGRTYSARAALIALPLGVLRTKAPRRGAVRFEPALRAKQKIAAKMGVGQVIRLTLRFDARRWKKLLPEKLRRARRGGFGFIHSRIEGVPVWWALSSASTLTGWSGGPQAAKLAGRSAEGIFERALSSLSRIWNVPKQTLRRAVVGRETHNWSSDPFSRGAYSFIAAGVDDAAEKLREPMQDTLFFAGEATADGAEVGTVHGAHASGLRAAEEVRKALQRSRRSP